jgi:hypothetical protein
MAEIREIIVHMRGGRLDGHVFRTPSSDPDSDVGARATYLVTKGEIGKVFLPHTREWTLRQMNEETPDVYPKYRISERHDDNGTVTLWADFIGNYDPNVDKR